MTTELAEPQTREEPVIILPVVFVGTGNLRLVRVARWPDKSPLAQKRETEGLSYEFESDGPGGRGGRLVVDQALIDRDREFFERNDPKFPKDGTGDPLTVQWIRNHALFGERIKEVPATPPDPAETLAQITAAGVRGDEDALLRLHEEEERTFKRAEILRPIESALAAIEEARARVAQGQGAPSAEVGTPGSFRPPQPE